MSLSRFHQLQSIITTALRHNQKEDMITLSEEYLELAEEYPKDWNYGNAIHTSHIALGEVAFMQGDIDDAKRHLLLAGATPGSPQLNSFGPNMQLANNLLKAGEKEIVLQYFDLCERYWMKPISSLYLEKWRSEIGQGRIPSFGGHLLYHFG